MIARYFKNMYPRFALKPCKVKLYFLVAPNSYRRVHSGSLYPASHSSGRDFSRA